MFLRWICWNCTRNPWNGNEATAWDQNTVACQHILQILRNQRWRDDAKCLFQLRLYFIVHSYLMIRPVIVAASILGDGPACYFMLNHPVKLQHREISSCVAILHREVRVFAVSWSQVFWEVDQGKAPWWPRSFQVDAIDASCLCPASLFPGLRVSSEFPADLKITCLTRRRRW
jgi:hypothetical protein